MLSYSSNRGALQQGRHRHWERKQKQTGKQGIDGVRTGDQLAMVGGIPVLTDRFSKSTLCLLMNSFSSQLERLFAVR